MAQVPTLYAFRGSGPALVLARDPEGNDHVVTIFNGKNIAEGCIIEVNGTLYKVHLTQRDW